MIPFEDAYPDFTASGYSIVNEEAETIRDLIGERQLGHHLAICSAGEVLLAALAPAAEKVLAVDHSYRSLAATMVKMLLIRQRGMGSFLELTKELSWFSQAAQQVWKDLPDPVRTQVTTEKIASAEEFSHGALYREWTRSLAGTESVARNIEASLEKISFLHGDIIHDTQAQAPFDSLYASNMGDHHNGRDSMPASNSRTLKVLKPGSLVIGSGYGWEIAGKPFTRLRLISGKRTSWRYSLHRLEEVRKVEKNE